MSASLCWLIHTSDLFPVGGGELVGEGADGVLQLQYAGVPLGQRTPQTLELLGQRPELGLGVLQLGLGSNGKKISIVFLKKGETVGGSDVKNLQYLQVFLLTVFFFFLRCCPLGSFLEPVHR